MIREVGDLTYIAFGPDPWIGKVVRIDGKTFDAIPLDVRLDGQVVLNIGVECIQNTLGENK